MKKQLGYVGLGKMGLNMVERLLEKGYDVVAYNKTPDAVADAARKGATGAGSIADLAEKLTAPRLVWLMVPYQAVDDVLAELLPHLRAGDTVIDGGNSPYGDSMRRGAELAKKEIRFLDVGVSGGPSGAREGACLMVGGEKETYENFTELFADIAAPEAYGYMGTSGAGHYVKMVHNGIEYGMMQAIGEGFNILKQSTFGFDVLRIARLYNRRSVIESRLMGWLADAYEKFGDNLDTSGCCSGSVASTGEGAWTVDEAHRLGLPDTIIHESLKFREESQSKPSYTGMVVSALRHEFGGHDARTAR